jgi:hypothetical protein
MFSYLPLPQFQPVAKWIAGVETGPAWLWYRLLNLYTRLEQFLMETGKILHQKGQVSSPLWLEDLDRAEMNLLSSVRAGLIPDSSVFMAAQGEWNVDFAQAQQFTIKVAGRYFMIWWNLNGYVVEHDYSMK